MDLILLFFIIFLALLAPTAYAAYIGAPYAPTFSPAIRKAFDYIKLGPNDTVIDIGAGDGKVLVAASKRGAKAIGYELSPIMWGIVWFRSLGNRRVKIKLRNFYKQMLPDATVVFAFLMPQNMDKVKKFLAKQVLPNGKYMLVYAFPFKDVEPQHVIRVERCAPVYIYDLQKLTKPSKPE